MKLIIKEDGAYMDDEDENIHAKHKCAKGRTPNKKKGHKKKKDVDWAVVKKLCAIQCTLQEIADFLEVSHDVIYEACYEIYGDKPSEVFKQWRNGGRCSMRRKQWRLADTSASMAIWLGKQYLEQKDNVENNNNSTTYNIVQYGEQPLKPWQKEEKSPEHPNP